MAADSNAGSEPPGLGAAAWWQPSINVVLYPVQFTTDPSAHVNHGLRVFLSSYADQAAEFVTAIEAALASGTAILLVGQPGPVPHSQDHVRAYLAGMVRGLEEWRQSDRSNELP